MLGKRFTARKAILAVVLAAFASGCKDDVGVSLLISPPTLDFGATRDQLSLRISKNFSASAVGPLVVSADAPWILPESCTDTADNCLSGSLVNQVMVPIRVDRSLMTLGGNAGTLVLTAGGASVQTVRVYAEDRLAVDFQTPNRTPAVGQAIAFTDLSIADDTAGPITQRLWNFGDGTTSAEENPIHVYLAVGQYDVSLTVTTRNSAETRTKAAYIAVAAGPVRADFEAAPRSIYQNESVRFTDLSTAGVTPINAWSWNFGDGGRSTDPNPTHQYPGPGIFSVSLTVTSALGSDTMTKTNYIVVQRKLPPTADFTLSQIKPFVRIPVQFTDLSDPGTAPIKQWVWEFGDGAISVDQHPTHAFPDVITYPVKLTVISDHGVGSKTLPVTVVYKPPTAEFTVSNTSPSINEVVQFTDRSEAGMAPSGPAIVDEWRWDFGDEGSSRRQNPVHSYTEEGTYTVVLTVGSSALPNDVTDTETKIGYIVVVKPPIPDFTLQERSPFAGDDLHFINETTAGTETDLTYEWNFGETGSASNLSSDANPTHRYAQPGTYTVRLTAVTPTRQVSVTKTFVVDGRPAPDFIAEPLQALTIHPIQFTDRTNTTNARPVELWRWNFGDGSPAVLGRNPQHIYPVAGRYSVTLTITYSHSVSKESFTASVTKTNYITITLPLPPEARFSAENPCTQPGGMISFIDLSDPGSADAIETYSWNFGDGGTSTQANPVHVYQNPGNYTVTLRVTTDAQFAPMNEDTTVVEDFVNVPDGPTALDEYVSAVDPTYAYEILSSQENWPVNFLVSGQTVSINVDVHVVRMYSQTWRSLADYRVVGTDSARWQHYMIIAAPKDVRTNTAMIFVDGGSNGGTPPSAADADTAILQLAALSGSVVVQLRQVPNESMAFEDDKDLDGTLLRTRTEDGIIAHTYNKYLDAYDPVSDSVPAESRNWPLLLPMVKSAVRAMDTVQRLYETDGLLSPCTSCGSTLASRIPVNKFVVSGGSKRGWTTWLTAAADPGPPGDLTMPWTAGNRVKAIVPLVIDVLNMDRNMFHQFNAYGYWAPAVYDYVQERIFDRFSPEHDQYKAGLALLQIVDPYEYRCRLEMPKLLVNASGDQFFLPDSAQWYFNRLQGTNFLNYVPNDDHGLSEDFSVTNTTSPVASLLGFYTAIAHNGTLPSFSWEFEDDGSIVVYTDSTLINGSVKLWQARAAKLRDFRLDSYASGTVPWTSTTLLAEVPGRYRGAVSLPTGGGYVGFFIQAQFSNAVALQGLSPTLRILAAQAGVSFPFTVTTPIRVLPENADGSNLYPVFAGSKEIIGSTKAAAVPLLVLHGSPEEMGLQYGELMADEINALIPNFLAAAQAMNPALTNAALDAAWDAVSTAADVSRPGEMSRYEIELRAVAEGAGINFDLLRRANMVPVLDNLSGLGVAATRTATRGGDTFQSNAVNWSLDLGLQNYPCAIIYVPGITHGFPHANLTFAGFVGALTGINLGGISVSSIADPDLPGDPTAPNLTGTHYTALFRELLYDAASIFQAEDLIFDSFGPSFETIPLRRQHLIVSDGRNLRQSRKYKIHGQDGLAGIAIWREGDPNDEYAPNVLTNIVYSGPAAGAFADNGVDDGPAVALLRSDLGVIDQNTLNDVNVVMTGGDLAGSYRTSVGDGDSLIPLVVVQGTPNQMGRAYGQLMQAEIQEFIPQFLAMAQFVEPTVFSNANLDTAWNSVSPYIDPRFIQELQGLAQGSGVPYDVIRRAHMIPVVSDYSCSSVAVWDTASANGHLYQTRNLDWDLEAQAHNYPCIVVYRPANGIAHVNVGFAGLVGSQTGINAKGITLAEMGDSPGSEYPYNLNGNHFMPMFRQILYDADTLTEALSILQSTPRIKRYHYVFGDGRGELRAVKIKAHAPVAPPNDLIIWTDNDPTDEFAPNVLPDVVYNDEGRGAYPYLVADHGTYDHTKMIALANEIPIHGSNVMNVVYDATSLEMWVAYAEGTQEAYLQPYVHVDLKPFLFGGNLLNVIYRSNDDEDLLVWVSYANGNQPASAATPILFNIQDYLP